MESCGKITVNPSPQKTRGLSLDDYINSSSGKQQHKAHVTQLKWIHGNIKPSSKVLLSLYYINMYITDWFIKNSWIQRSEILSSHLDVHTSHTGVPLCDFQVWLLTPASCQCRFLEDPNHGAGHWILVAHKGDLTTTSAPSSSPSPAPVMTDIWWMDQRWKYFLLLSPSFCLFPSLPPFLFLHSPFSHLSNNLKNTWTYMPQPKIQTILSNFCRDVSFSYLENISLLSVSKNSDTKERFVQLCFLCALSIKKRLWVVLYSYELLLPVMYSIFPYALLYMILIVTLFYIYSPVCLSHSLISISFWHFNFSLSFEISINYVFLIS